MHFPFGCSLRSKRFRAMTQLETLATQANSVVVKVLRIHFTLECIACNSKGLEKARTWEKNNNRLNEVTGKEITQPWGVCVGGGGSTSFNNTL